MTLEYGTIKYKLMVVIMMAGEYPYKSIDLIDGSIGRTKMCIKDLRDCGYIDVKNVSGVKRIRYKMFNKRKNEYVKDLFMGAENYEPDIRSNGASRLERKDRIAEVVITMMEAGVNITPDVKPPSEFPGPLNENEECLPYYITSKEARAALIVKEDKGKGTRFHGTMVSRGGVYNIYNMGNTMMEWIRPQERVAIEFIKQYERKMVPWGKDSSLWCGESAIVFSRNMDFIVDFVNGNVSRKFGYRKSKRVVNINEYYKKTFYLPLSHQGQIMLNMMTKKNWHYYLVGMFYKRKYLASDTVKMSIACDALKDGCYGLVFMDGDIGRLKRFASIEVAEKDKGKYKVICYDFQEEIVKKIVPPGMNVLSYNFEEVVNAFYQIYEKYEND